MFRGKPKAATASTGSAGTGGDYGMLYLPGADSDYTIANGTNVFASGATLAANSSLVTLVNGGTAMQLGNAGTYEVTFGVCAAEIPIGGTYFSLYINDGAAADFATISCNANEGTGAPSALANLMISMTAILTFTATTQLSIVNNTGSDVNINSLQLSLGGPQGAAAYITVVRLQ